MEKLCILLAVLLFQVGSGIASFNSAVKFLPGFDGPLPFELETGYIGVDESEEVHLFYYFVKSQRNFKEDPLLLWLTGGPGCSALSGLIYEIGPFTFKVAEYNGSLPTLILNPHSWTQVASIIFVDMPVGTGFSYTKAQLASYATDLKQVHQADQFLRKWLRDHPEFLSNPVYIAGDSYSGKILPAIVQQIIDGAEVGTEPLINLQGYIIGNPVTDSSFDTNAKIPFAHGMALISDELYASLKISCREDYVNIDPTNTQCLKYMDDYDKCTSGLLETQILEPTCGYFASPKPFELVGKRRSLIDNNQDLQKIDCRIYGYTLSYNWTAYASVRRALHVREGTVKEWLRCNYDLPYTYEISSSVNYHAYLSNKGYRSLIYSGDHDFMVPYIGTQGWIRYLNYSIVDDWRPWLVQGQVAGYTRTYSNQMTFATVKGGGHTAPEYKPVECLAMIKRWLNQEPL